MRSRSRLFLSTFVMLLLTGPGALTCSTVDSGQAHAAAVKQLDGDRTLRDEFNADRGKVRLLMILSPT